MLLQAWAMLGGLMGTKKSKSWKVCDPPGFGVVWGTYPAITHCSEKVVLANWVLHACPQLIRRAHA